MNTIYLVFEEIISTQAIDNFNKQYGTRLKKILREEFEIRKSGAVSLDLTDLINSFQIFHRKPISIYSIKLTKKNSIDDFSLIFPIILGSSVLYAFRENFFELHNVIFSQRCINRLNQLTDCRKNYRGKSYGCPEEISFRETKIIQLKYEIYKSFLELEYHQFSSFFDNKILPEFFDIRKKYEQTLIKKLSENK